MSLREIAQKFAKDHNGTITEELLGYSGPIAFVIKCGSKFYHIYFAREWYRKYDGITIPRNTLNVAVKQNAMIVIFVAGTEYWKHSSLWLGGQKLTNTMHDTVEVLMPRQDLENPGAKFPQTMDGWF